MSDLRDKIIREQGIYFNGITESKHSHIDGNDLIFRSDVHKVFKQILPEIISLCQQFKCAELLVKANARLSSAIAQSAQANSVEFEATHEGRIRELHWLIDEIEPPEESK